MEETDCGRNWVLSWWTGPCSVSQFSSVSLAAQPCLTLCNSTDCRMPGFPVHHQLPELTQTHIHRVGDAIQPSHPLSSPSSPALNLSQHQGLFQGVSSSHPVAKVLSLIQYSVEGQGCVHSLLFDLRPCYGRGNEDNGDLLQKVLCTHCYIQYPWPWSRPLLTMPLARDSWTFTGKNGSVSCGVTAPFSWILVCTKFCLCPPRVCFPSPVKVL